MDDKQRISHLEEKVAWLEEQVRLMQAEPHTTQPYFETAKESNVQISPIQKEPVDWEQVIGRVWLPRIFIFVLLLGVIWGFSAAVREGILTEPVRCGLGAVAAVGLGFLGERQIRAARTALGQVLLGGAVSVGILTVFASHVLYGLIPAPVAFVLDLLLLIAGVYLAHHHRSQALAILASLGGVLVPFMLKSQQPSTLFFIGYETILSVSFLYFALRHRFIGAYVATLVSYHVALPVFYGFANGHISKDVFAYGVLSQHVALLVYLMISKQSLKVQLAALFTSFAVTVAWMDSLLDTFTFEWYLLTFAILYAALAVWFRDERRGKLVTATAIAFFALMLYFLEVFSGTAQAIPLLLEGACALWLALMLRSGFQFYTGLIIFGVGMIETVSRVIVDVTSLVTLSWVVLLIVLVMLYQTSAWMNNRENVQQGKHRLQLIGKILLSVSALVFLVFLTELTQCLTKRWDIDLQQMAVSFVWALYAIVGIVYGIWRGSKSFRLVGVILLFLTLLKLILIDLPSVSIAVRAILFIVIGGIGVAVSRFFYTKEKK